MKKYIVLPDGSVVVYKDKKTSEQFQEFRKEYDLPKDCQLEIDDYNEPLNFKS